MYQRSFNHYTDSKSIQSFSVTNKSCKEFIRSPYRNIKIQPRYKNKQHPLYYFQQHRRLNSNHKQFKDYNSNTNFLDQRTQKVRNNMKSCQSFSLPKQRNQKKKNKTSKGLKQFESIFNRKSRFEKTMSLKSHSVKKQRMQKSFDLKDKNQQKKNQQKQLSKSYKLIEVQSMMDDQSNTSSQYRSNFSKTMSSTKTKSRFQRIMSLKVQKPVVCSTLVNYQPKKTAKKQIIQLNQQDINIKRENKLDMEWIRSTKQYNQNIKQNEKQHALWKQFERDRQKRIMENKNKQNLEYKNQRRKQKMFESMVIKQIEKIKREKQIQKRKNLGFSKYIYSLY